VSQNPDGSYNPPQSFAWDVAGNTQDPSSLPMPTTGVPGDDTLTGGPGADTYVYRTGDGTDTITDFNIAEGDRIDLTGVAGVHDISDLLITQDGANTVITLGSGLVLKNVDKETLTPAQFLFSQAPNDIVLSNASIAENSPAGSTVGTLTARDADPGETFVYSLLDNAGGRFSLDGTSLLVTALLDYESATSYEITVRVTDHVGNMLDKTFVIGLINVNEAPTGAADGANVNEDASILINVLANDSDVDLDALTITSLSGSTSMLGASISIENGQIRYTADADAFDLATFAGAIDEFTYTASDPGGLSTGPIRVQVTVSAADDQRTLNGTVNRDNFTDTAGFDTTYFAGNANDIVRGQDGSDSLHGENGDDQLFGGTGIDFLFGGKGNDTLAGDDGNDRLDGGEGNDRLRGGNGSDVFVLGNNPGKDTIADFVIGIDHLQLDGLTVASLATADVDRTGPLDAVLSFDQGGSLTVLGAGGISDWDLLL
jgi:Ca2+-binding RTX toxin-like protein